MLLSELADPIATWQAAERYLGGGTRDYSRFAADLQIDPRYHPQRGPARFTVPSFWVEPGRGRYLTGAAGSLLHGHYRDGARFLLPVHPQALTAETVRTALAGAPPGPPLSVVPSGNARTVFVERIDDRPVPPHFVKLHYPGRLSRFTRRLRLPVITLQLWVADELHRIGAPVLPEVGGGVIGDDPRQAWGFLLREPAPRHGPALPYRLPLFALYGRDVRAPQHPSLLEQLVRRSGEQPRQWVRSRLINPVVSLWARTLLATGCAIEPHGQNTLLCLSEDLRRSTVCYRDCAVYVDPAIRAERGLSGSLPPRNVISQDVPVPREQVLSLVYDCFMGNHTLAYVARLLRSRFGVPSAALHDDARAAFAAALARPQLLPPTVYYYDDQLHDDGGWRLVDTGAAPQWR